MEELAREEEINKSKYPPEIQGLAPPENETVKGFQTPVLVGFKDSTNREYTSKDIEFANLYRPTKRKVEKNDESKKEDTNNTRLAIDTLPESADALLNSLLDRIYEKNLLLRKLEVYANTTGESILNIIRIWI